MMTLKEYLVYIRMRSTEAAGILGLHPVYFNRIVNGHPPGPKNAILIEEWSEGNVPRHILRPDLWPPPPEGTL